MTFEVEDTDELEPQGERPDSEPQEAGGRERGERAEEEEALRRRLEEELGKLRVEDVLLQSVASIVNLTARRIAKEDERDLEQARVGIEAVRAVLPLLPGQPQAQIRNALSELQILYAREAGEQAAEPSAPTEAEGEETGEAAPPPPKPPRKPPGLWTPPGST